MKKTLSCFVVFALLYNSNLYANSKYQISGKVELEFDKGKPSTSIPTAVVYVTGFEEAASSKIIEISQKNEAFDPSLSFLVQGQSIKFINKDKKSHNIFSNSKAREFDLGTKEPTEEEIARRKKELLLWKEANLKSREHESEN